MINMNIEYLTSIKRLDVPESLNAASTTKLCAKLEEFVQILPRKTYEWTRLFSVRDYYYLIKQLRELMSFLDSIYANSLSDLCSNLINDLNCEKKANLEQQMQKFFTELMTLSIDIQTTNYKQSTAFPAHVSIKRNSEEKKTILAVDDSPFMLKILEDMIDDEHYIFHGTTSGTEALNYLHANNPDLFILDIEMPKMNGYELLKNIRKMGNVSPLIFLTGNATQEYVLRAIQLGADGFLAKPVEKHLVREKIKELLG